MLKVICNRDLDQYWRCTLQNTLIEQSPKYSYRTFNIETKAVFCHGICLSPPIDLQ